MSEGRFMENYGLSENLLGKLYTSRGRARILNSLSTKPMTLADVSREVGMSSPNAAATIKDLEGLYLVEKRGGRYNLTHWGRIISDKTGENIRMVAAFDKFKDFWTTHHMGGIPEELLCQIGVLIDSNLVKTKDLNVTEVHDSFVALLNSIKNRFYGISPIYHEDYAKATSFLVHKGVDTRIVVTGDVLNKLIRDLEREELVFWSKCPNLRLYVTDQDLRVAFTVSDSFISLALRSRHNKDVYMDMDLQNHNPQAVEWGLKLFEYYKKSAVPVRWSDYL